MGRDVRVDDVDVMTTNTSGGWFYIRMYMKFWVSLFDLLSSSSYLLGCCVVLFIISECGILVLMNRVVLEVTKVASSSLLTIPDMRIGYTPNDLIVYCGSIGENGREAYVNMMYYDLYPYMLGYSLTFGLLTHYLASAATRGGAEAAGVGATASSAFARENNNKNHLLRPFYWKDLQLYVSWIFPTAMLFDIVESTAQLQCCKYYYNVYEYYYYNDETILSLSLLSSMNYILLVLGCIGNLGKWILLIAGFTFWIALLLLRCTSCNLY